MKDAILGLVTKSANDASTVIAENISGSEKRFAERMTRTARQLGMSKTTFRNPHGLPNSKQRTTARDMATLGRAIQERFPKYYGYFKTRSFKYRGRTYRNHNRLLGRVKGVDGIKTGYTRASGFNLTSSVKRNGRHIVAVVMGGRTGARRNAQMTRLISRYLPKASKGKRTAPLLVKKAPTGLLSQHPSRIRHYRSTSPAPLNRRLRELHGPGVDGTTKPAAAPSRASATIQAAAPVPGFGDQIPLPPKSVKNRIDHTFSVASALPPIPRNSPDGALTTQSVFKTKLMQAAKREAQKQGLTPKDNVVQTASLGTARTSAPPFKTVEVETISVQPANVKTVKIDTVKVTPVAVAPAPEIAREETDATETVTVATSDRQDVEPSWQVQIAAAETEGQAITMLKKAKAKTGSALRGRVPYTEPVDANGQTLYRARFVGFETKTAAKKACRSLKRAKYACFAIYQ